MTFKPETSFKINPEILYVEKGPTIHFTTYSLESKIMSVSAFAKEVFLMAQCNFPYSEIHAVADAFIQEIPDIHKYVDALLRTFIDKDIFTPQ